MKRLALAACLVPLLGGIAACEDKAVTLQKEVAELRFEQQEHLDALYADYGKGELAAAAHKKATSAGEKKAAEADSDDDKALAKELFTAVSNAVLDIDRSAFDGHCIDVGKGERAVILSPKARAFFDRADVKAECKEVAQLEFSVVGKETELKRLAASAP